MPGAYTSAYPMTVKGAHPVPCVPSSEHSFAILAGTGKEVAVWSVLTANRPDCQALSCLQNFPFRQQTPNYHYHEQTGAVYSCV
jgi:hypothetical protein